MTTPTRGHGRRTKIIATLGPATDAILPALIEAGMDVARINCSHGTIAEHLARIDAIRSAATASGQYIAVFADLPGPQARPHGPASARPPKSSPMMTTFGRVVRVTVRL